MRHVEYISKRCNDATSPWQEFGAPDQAEYEKWSKEVCGICCVKMVGDTLGLTSHVSLYELAMECKSLGGFRELPNGEILGVFHQPLLELAHRHGLTGTVERNLDLKKVKESLQMGKYVIVSISRTRFQEDLKGGHLLLIHSYLPETNTFVIHDSEPLLAKTGRNILIDQDSLARISNQKGLVIWKEERVYE